ncbi:tRNA(Ile)-lysidine synthase [Flavobacterium caeni]|uniref:tRNA(Ile)-lysidine synthase n=2 Tax=Flavobacterium caeni TaxID=490189 RepID=A0A1G5B573_9FLAO|nr:tRNA(Ile)-lysidine synthase [Flavobacterium caeni]
MLSDFKSHIAQNFRFLEGKKLLLAVSGGLDSMVLLDLFWKADANVSIAHCNFQLRGNESDVDANFIESFANQNQIPFFAERFDTHQFASDYKLSTQMAARELRYRWFAELAEQHGFDFILTAHHANDNLETFLINLSRGSGIDGLVGIPAQIDNVVRPLLGFSRNEIEAYAKTNRLEWREDSSNASTKYLRNQIRHQVVPALEAIDPAFLSAFLKTQSHLQQTQSMARDAAVLVYKQVARETHDEIHFNLEKLLRLPNYAAYLYHWLHEFGFTAWDDINDLTSGQSGKQVLSPRYRLVKDRDFLILSSLKDSNEIESFVIEKDQNQVNFPIKLSICKADGVSHVSNNTIFVDAQKIDFPLELRKWRNGDHFQPIGMNGQSKKVGKFFKDERFSILEKERAWLLCSGDRIVWIVGHRADERFKVQTTNPILKITLTQ